MKQEIEPSGKKFPISLDETAFRASVIEGPDGIEG